MSRKGTFAPPTLPDISKVEISLWVFFRRHLIEAYGAGTQGRTEAKSTLENIVATLRPSISIFYLSNLTATPYDRQYVTFAL